MASKSINPVLTFIKDVNGYPAYGFPFTPYSYVAVLAANTVQTVTVPENVNTAFFSFVSSSGVWVDAVNTAAVPTGTFAQSYAQLNPVERVVEPGEVLSFISSTSSSVSVSFYINKII